MEQQKNSLPSNANINFSANPFPSTFPGLNSVAATSNVVTSPLFMSSLQQLSTGAAAGFLPSTNQLGSSWNAQCQQTASWIDQANKMAAILPMYNALQTAVNASDPSYIQQNLKNQAAVVAAAACMPNALFFPPQPLSAVTEPSSSMSYSSSSDQTKNCNQRPWNEASPPSCSQSTSTCSHAASNEGVESPLNNTNMAVNEGSKSGAGNIASLRLSNASMEELSTLELHDFGEYFTERAKELGNAFPGSLFGVEDTLLTSTSKSLSMEQRSSSCETKPSSSSMRSHESIHDEQQAEELANADFELDRLVSLVARQNDANIIAPLPTTSSSLFSLDAFKTPEKADKQLHLLNPPQFTPPDSPTNQDGDQKPSSAILSLSNQPFSFASPKQSDAKSCSSTPSTSTSLQSKADTSAVRNKSPGLPLMFLPKVSPNRPPVKTSYAGGRMVGMGSIATAAKSTRVPIYKSSKSSMFSVKELAGPSTSFSQEKPDDAFSFTDDEEPEPPVLPQPIKPSSSQKMGIQSVYVPATANSSENESDVIKHVVPKKRHLVQKNVVEETDSTSSVHNQSSCSILGEDGATSQTSSAHSSLAKLIRDRRNKKGSSFVRTEFAQDNDCVCLDQGSDSHLPVYKPPLATCSIKIEEPDEQSEVVKSKESPRPSLPKLVIKLLTAKKEPEQSNENELFEAFRKEKKKRKKKKRDKDKDWVMAGQERSKKEKHHAKRKKHKKHKKEKRRMSVDCEGDPTSSPNHLDSESSSRKTSFADDNWESTLYSKKRRQISQWNGSEEDPAEAAFTMDDNFVSARPKTNCDTSFVSERLKCFSKVDGQSLSKGTFLVVKEEAFKPDCPLWKVDNQNLLQKYLPLVLSKPTSDEKVEEIRRYKNSSTYAGWCEQISDEYLIVEIRYVKHSRSENIIEPIIPIADLIPAVSSEIAGQSAVRTDEDVKRERTTTSDEVRMGDNGLKAHLNTFLHALLNHAVTLNFLQTVKSTNDWNFLCALDEFDQRNEKACQKVSNKVKWREEFQAALHNYSHLSTVQADFVVADTCQACANTEVSAIAQLFANESYDRETLLVDEADLGDGNGDLAENSPLPATEFFLCRACKLAATVYHGIYHMKYHTFKLAEEKLEATCEENPELTAESVIQLCLNNKSWIQNWLNDYMDLCRKADEVFS